VYRVLGSDNCSLLIVGDVNHSKLKDTDKGKDQAFRDKERPGQKLTSVLIVMSFTAL